MPVATLQRQQLPIRFLKTNLATTITPENKTPPPKSISRPLPYVQGVSELIANHLRPYKLTIAHKQTEYLQKVLVNLKDPFPCRDGEMLCIASLALSAPTPIWD